jgi:hypothetical protein
MALNIAEVLGNLRTVNVTWQEQNFAVTYRPGVMTPRNSSEIAERVDKGEAKNVIVETLSSTLVSWEIVGETGEMLPITQENLEKLPGGMLLGISEAIAEDMLPKPKSAKGSFRR